MSRVDCHVQSSIETSPIYVGVAGLVCALSLGACTLLDSPGPGRPLLVSYADAPISISAVQMDASPEAVFSSSPLLLSDWVNKNQFFSTSGFRGFADTLACEGNILEAKGLLSPIVVERAEPLVCTLALANQYELVHDLHVVMMVDNHPARIETSHGPQGYIVVDGFLPGSDEAVVLQFELDLEPGWHVIDLIYLLDTAYVYDEPAKQVAQQFSFTATRWEVFVGADFLNPTGNSPTPDPAVQEVGTLSELGNIQVIDPASGDLVTRLNPGSSAPRELVVEVIRSPETADGLPPLPTRMVVLVNDLPVAYQDVLVGTAEGSMQRINLEIDPGQLQAGDRVLIMAVPFATTQLRSPDGGFDRVQYPRFSRVIWVDDAAP